MVSNMPASAASAGPVPSSDEISGLRAQIFSNGNCLYYSRNELEIIVMTAEYPENGWYTAKLIDPNERVVLCGSEYAPSIVEALRQLLRQTCNELRDSMELQKYTCLKPNMV